MTHFVVFATDSPGREALRAANRPLHRAYLCDPGAHPVRVLLGGPTLAEAGDAMIGTLLVVEAPELASVRAFLADDPYVRAGPFETVIVRPWQWGLGRPATPSGSPSRCATSPKRTPKRRSSTGWRTAPTHGSGR